MAEQRANPADPHLNINASPPTSTGTQSNAPFTPRSTSFADDSDAEYDPTPLHSPRNGPTYDDLPPSYSDSQEQALTDARNGVAPLDPNQIEAHRLTSNEAPNEPEVWEYRVRGENAEEHERAPKYQNVPHHMGTTVPVQHVSESQNIPVGHVAARSISSEHTPNPIPNLLTKALQFTKHEPDSDVQYAPRLSRCVAIPQDRPSNGESGKVQFLRAYAKALHAHSIRPAEFAEFLDGLNALCVASNVTHQDLLTETPGTDARLNLVHDYIRGANEAFFGPRGLRVSLRSLSSLVEVTNIPTERGQRAGAIASATDESSTVERRAQALHPWIEALDTNLPEQSAQTLMLREMAARLDGQENGESTPSAQFEKLSVNEKGGQQGQDDPHGDPPHSVPEPNHNHHHEHPRHHSHGGRGHPPGPWSPFGMPGHGPFGAPGNGPFGPPGRGPFGPVGHGPFGAPGNVPFHGHGHFPAHGHMRGSFGGRGYPHRGMAGGFSHPSRADAHGSNNEWSSLGRDLGRMGEEFGKRMEQWGQNFGRQAGTWGEDFGRQANTWGQDLGRQASTWGQDIGRRASGRGNHVSYGASGSGTRGNQTEIRPEDTPPSYPGQESGVLHADTKAEASSAKSDEKSLKKDVEKKEKHDDDSSISSDSDSDSDSDLDSESDDEDLPDSEAVFLKRVRSINKQAEAAEKKGKKSAQEIAQERSLAIEEAQNEKTKMDAKFQHKLSKRAASRDLKRRRRELMREHRQKKRDLKAAHSMRGKGKGKAKRTPEWKEAKKEYLAKKKELRNEKLAARKEWREARANSKKLSKQYTGGSVGQRGDSDTMVWVVIENLGH